MLKIAKIVVLLMGGVIIGLTQSIAQTTQPPTEQQKELNWTTYSFVEDSSPWISSPNPSGLLKMDEMESISFAELYFESSNGGVVNYNQSDDSYLWGAQTKSIYRLSPKIVLRGAISYESFKGKNMSGSAFIDPTYTPFDITEFDDSNSGDKSLERYNLVGSIGLNLYKNLLFGAEIDFTGANYAKSKDLRHANRLSDLNLSLGLSQKVGGKVQVGITYLFRKRVEGVRFNTYGTSGDHYFSLINYGVFWGRKEVFSATGSGYTDSSEAPLHDMHHGAALQFSVDLSPYSLIYLNGGYSKRTGESGLKTNHSKLFSQHDESIYDFDLTYQLTKDRYRHFVIFSGEFKSLLNSENVTTTESTDQGSTIVYLDVIKVGERDNYNISLTYKGEFAIDNMQPQWSVYAQFGVANRSVTASRYPYFRTQKIDQKYASMRIARNFVFDNNNFEVALAGAYASGDGDIYSEGKYSDTGAEQSSTSSSTQMLHREYEYLTAPQFTVEPAIKYSRQIKSNIKGYISLNYSYTGISDVEYLSSDTRQQFYLTLGCSF